MKEKEEYKSEEQKSAIKNIRIFYKAQQKVIDLYNDYSKIISKAKFKETHKEGLKIFKSKTNAS